MGNHSLILSLGSWALRDFRWDVYCGVRRWMFVFALRLFEAWQKHLDKLL